NTIPNPTYYIEYLANPSLKPETAYGSDIGGSLRLPDRNSIISLDLYLTTLHGQYFYNESQIGTYLGLPLLADQNRNLGSSRYEGIEFAYNYNPPHGLFFSTQGSLQRAYTYGIPNSFYATAAGGPFSTNLTILPNVNFIGGASGLDRIPYSQ